MTKVGAQFVRNCPVICWKHEWSEQNARRGNAKQTNEENASLLDLFFLTWLYIRGRVIRTKCQERECKANWQQTNLLFLIVCSVQHCYILEDGGSEQKASIGNAKQIDRQPMRKMLIIFFSLYSSEQHGNILEHEGPEHNTSIGKASNPRVKSLNRFRVYLR